MKLKKSFLIIIVLLVAFIVLGATNVQAAEVAFESRFESGEDSSVTAEAVAGGTVEIVDSQVILTRMSCEFFSHPGLDVKEGYDAYYFSFYGEKAEQSTIEGNLTLKFKMPVSKKYNGMTDFNFDGEARDVSFANGCIYFTCTVEYPNGNGTVYLAKGAQTPVVAEPEKPAESKPVSSVPAQKEETVVTISESAPVVDTSVFADAKANNKSVAVVVPGKVTWRFSGVTNDAIAMNANVDITSEKPSFIKNDAVKDAVFVDFTHSGALPGKAAIELNVGTAKFGTGAKTLYLYYYNPGANTYEYMNPVSYNNGIANIDLGHCSTYVLMEKRFEIPESPAPAVAAAPVAEAPAAIAATGTLDKEPKAGEVSLLPVALLSIVSLAVAIYIKK